MIKTFLIIGIVMLVGCANQQAIRERNTKELVDRLIAEGVIKP